MCLLALAELLIVKYSIFFVEHLTLICNEDLQASVISYFDALESVDRLANDPTHEFKYFIFQQQLSRGARNCNGVNAPVFHSLTH